MVEGLASLLLGTHQSGVNELRAALRQLLGQRHRHCKLVEQLPLQSSNCQVFRLVFDCVDGGYSVVVKRHKPCIAQRNEAVLQKWLPAVGLQEHSPQLLGVAAARGGKCVWHVYEDLGPWALEPREPSPERITAAVRLIARLHTAFVLPLLAEVRLLGGDLGFTFFLANLRDALRCLESLRPPLVGVSPEQARLRERLLHRMRALLAEPPWRAQLLADCGGPETLLHGDLWTSNAFVRPVAGSYRAWLIDWDHTAVGPVSYDLSTFLMRFPKASRPWILQRYRTALSARGWQLPGAYDLNRLFETAELSRLANIIVWPALALARQPKGWGWDRLAEVDQWLEQMEPVLPPEQTALAAEFTLP